MLRAKPRKVPGVNKDVRRGMAEPSGGGYVKQESIEKRKKKNTIPSFSQLEGENGSLKKKKNSLALTTCGVNHRHTTPAESLR